MKPHMHNQKEQTSLFRGIMLGHLILLLHVLLLAGVGLLVIFFHGILKYLPYILVSGLVLIGIGAYCLFNWLKSRGKNLKQILDSPALSGKSVEINLLGGVASIKIGPCGTKESLPAIESENSAPPPIDQKQARVIALPELGRASNPIAHSTSKGPNRKFFKWKN